MVDSLLLVEHASDIDLYQSDHRKGESLFFSPHPEVIEELQRRGLPTLFLGSERAHSEGLFRGADEFALRLAENWYLEPWIRPYQQYRSIDTGGIVDREMTYYVIWLLKNVLLLKSAIEKTSPHTVCYPSPKPSRSLAILDPYARLAYRSVPFLRETFQYPYRESALPVRGAPWPTQVDSSAKARLKHFFGEIIGSDFGRYRLSHKMIPGILFSSDLKHVFNVMKRFRGGPSPLFYARPHHGLRTSTALWNWGVRFLKLSDRPSDQGEEISLLREVLGKEEFPRESRSSSLYCFGGVDFFPFLLWKLGECFPDIFSGVRRAIDAFHRFFDRQPIRLVVTDEDVCFFNKALVQVGGSRGIPRVVIQHGGMGHRKGFTPLSSDFIFCWGENDKQRLLEWGVPEIKIRVTGCSRYDQILTLKRSSLEQVQGLTRGPREKSREAIVLFVSSPYHDSYRPDFIRTYVGRESHFRTLGVLSQLMRAYPQLKFIYKFHPRDPHVEETKHRLKGLAKEGRICFEQNHPLIPLLLRARYVLAEWSTACVEAILLEKPSLVVNLESDLDLFPMIEDRVAMGAKTEEELRSRFRELIEMSDQKINEWKEHMRQYAPRLHSLKAETASEGIFKELQGILTSYSREERRAVAEGSPVFVKS